jgi:hypothetical protein
VPASARRTDRWGRDYEFLYRGGEVLLARLADLPQVRQRREAALNFQPLAASSYEARRLSPALDPIIPWFADQWTTLYDAWNRDRRATVFEDGYALLFFLRVLMSGPEVLLRGHADETWELETTAARFLRVHGQEKFRKARLAAQAFVDKLEALDFVRDQYPKGLRPDQREAVCQHYGFPTEYLDLTFSWDVALYFAEDWMRLPAESQPEIGALYAIPAHVIARDASLITLPPSIMRPNLQSGKFLRCDSQSLLKRIRAYKFRYWHAGTQYSRGLNEISYTTWPNLSHFLFPSSDPIEAIAAGLRNW